MIKKFSIILLLLIVSTMTAIAASNNEQIRELSTQLQKMQIVDATRKDYSESSDIARRKKMSELDAQIYQLRQAQINDINQQLNELEQEVIQFLENLKTCKVSNIRAITERHSILGMENGFCRYRVSFGTKTAIICKFPMTVAKQYAQESINSIKNRSESKFLEDVSAQYCSWQSAK